MYSEVGIQKLSENQLPKLRNGHPVRTVGVELGNHHNLFKHSPSKNNALSNFDVINIIQSQGVDDFKEV